MFDIFVGKWHQQSSNYYWVENRRSTYKFGNSMLASKHLPANYWGPKNYLESIGRLSVCHRCINKSPPEKSMKIAEQCHHGLGIKTSLGLPPTYQMGEETYWFWLSRSWSSQTAVGSWRFKNPTMVTPPQKGSEPPTTIIAAYLPSFGATSGPVIPRINTYHMHMILDSDPSILLVQSPF